MLQDNEDDIYLFMCLFIFAPPYSPPERTVVNEKILENKDDISSVGQAVFWTYW